MPSWFTAYIEITGDDEQLDKLVKALEYNMDDGVSSILDVYLPTPDPIASIEELWDGFYLSDTNVRIAQDMVDRLKEQYGCADWFEWNMVNYGTKWSDATILLANYDNSQTRTVFLRMRTPGTFPYKGIATVFRQHFPKLTFEATYKSETGSTGNFYAEAGKWDQDNPFVR